MSVKMDVQMTPRAMYDFLLYHTYSHLSGLIGAIFGVVVLGLGIRAMAQGDYTAGMMFFFFAAVFLVMTPLTLKSKAKACLLYTSIGVHQDGLVHISQITDKKFIKHPLEAVSVGDIVDVKVMSVDVQKKRIQLTMKGI